LGVFGIYEVGTRFSLFFGIHLLISTNPYPEVLPYNDAFRVPFSSRDSKMHPRAKNDDMLSPCAVNKLSKIRVLLKSTIVASRPSFLGIDNKRALSLTSSISPMVVYLFPVFPYPDPVYVSMLAAINGIT